MTNNMLCASGPQQTGPRLTGECFVSNYRGTRSAGHWADRRLLCKFPPGDQDNRRMLCKFPPGDQAHRKLLCKFISGDLAGMRLLFMLPSGDPAGRRLYKSSAGYWAGKGLLWKFPSGNRAAGMRLLYKLPFGTGLSGDCYICTLPSGDKAGRSLLCKLSSHWCRTHKRLDDRPHWQPLVVSLTLNQLVLRP